MSKSKRVLYKYFIDSGQLDLHIKFTHCDFYLAISKKESLVNSARELAIRPTVLGLHLMGRCNNCLAIIVWPRTHQPKRVSYNSGVGDVIVSDKQG